MACKPIHYLQPYRAMAWWIIPYVTELDLDLYCTESDPVQFGPTAKYRFHLVVTFLSRSYLLHYHFNVVQALGMLLTG